MKHCAFAVLSSVVLCAAAAFSQAQKSAPPAGATTKPPEVSLPQNHLHTSPPPPELLDKLKAQLDDLRGRGSVNNLCYSMDTYVFARDGQGDATRLVARRDCTRASLFRLKRIPATVQESPSSVKP